MPQCVSQAIFGFFRRWFVFVFLFSQFIRIGEAAVPGPAEDSFLSFPHWVTPSLPDFCLGVGNPGGIANKHHMFETFPVGWWHLTETQASKAQQCSFQKSLKSFAFRQDRLLRSCMGHPAPLRSNSDTAGSWTGVLSFGDCPIRQVPCVWPPGLYPSGRIDLAVAHICGLEIAAATVYCPPRGPTFPRAREMSEALLAPITEQLVFGRSGPRVILGDFNCPAGTLVAMKHWVAQGWIELQAFLHHTFGVEPQPTCKASTAPDQIWISPELFPFIVNGSVWNIFPDHAMLIAGLKLPSLRSTELQWRLPGRIPWHEVDQELWTSSADIGPLVPVGGTSSAQHADIQGVDSSDVFRQWSEAFEIRASKSMKTKTAKLDRSFHGRAQLCQPQHRRINAIVVKHARPGELSQANGFLNRATSRWYKQLRRLQSYLHAVRSIRSEENWVSRLQLWNSIKYAAGFVNGFEAWWKVRPHPMQGSPVDLPGFPPSSEVAFLILEDYTQHYRRFEHWQHERRKQSCRQKVHESAKGLFSLTRKPAKPASDFLEDDFSQSITVIDGHLGLIEVDVPFPTSNIHKWTLQDSPAWVWPEGHLYRVESDLVLTSGQTLTCTSAIQDEQTIHARLADLWTPRWNRHSEVPADRWTQIIDFARDQLPHTPLELPPISVTDWKAAVHRFKLTAATGPCGWTREDLVNLTDTQIHHVLDFFSYLESGGSWPEQMSVGLIHCLQKRDNIHTVNGFRPITVSSLFYRVYAGIRAGQLLAWLAKSASFMQCGFLKGKQAADIWYFVGICVEVSLQTQTPTHGCVADVIKAYNTLPRRPVFEALRLIGAPVWFLDLWARHLAVFTRYFVVRKSCGPALKSVTGFAEGCPLSCVAMCVIGHLWHRWQISSVPRAIPLSYVDNLELISLSLPALVQSVDSLRSFCQCLDISIDESCLYAWSTCSAGRHELKIRGFQVNRGTRDLGGQVDYTAQLQNKVLTNRIDETLPWFISLRSSSHPVKVKMLNITQVLLPRGLHACEAIIVGSAHLKRLRSHVMKALRWDRAGASPIIRIALIHTFLDPFWYQVWHCVTQFRHQAIHNSSILDWWKIFCDSATGQTHGPFGKLFEQLSILGLRLSSDGRLWFSDNGYINVLAASESTLKRVMQSAFHDSQTPQVGHRKDYADLEGCDVGLTIFWDHSLTVQELEYVNIARDGAFVSNANRNKFDSRKPAHCWACGEPDTFEHKYKTCSKYDSIRRRFSSLVSQWNRLPDSFVLHGLVPANPWRTLMWEALIALDDCVDSFEFSPDVGVVHGFTDGSCSNPTVEEDSLAAWAVIQPGRGTVSCGPLVGIQQNIARAETTAVLSATLWGHAHWGSVHIWTDNQNVVDHYRQLLQGSASPSDFEHQDLWERIAQTLNTASATFLIHKVPGHDDISNCESPFEEWCRAGNRQADKQAGLSNTQRPLYFERVWSGYQAYRQTWKSLVKDQIRFQLAIAQQEVKDQSDPEIECDFEEEFVQPIFLL